MTRAILVFMLIASSVSAEPSPTVNWLMDEPASLFDIGMLRLRQENDDRWLPRLSERISELSLLAKGEALQSSSVVYDIKENRITIGAMFKGRPDEGCCAEILAEYRDAIS